jgi:hypothetical protein
MPLQLGRRSGVIRSLCRGQILWRGVIRERSTPRSLLAGGGKYTNFETLGGPRTGQ